MAKVILNQDVLGNLSPNIVQLTDIAGGGSANQNGSITCPVDCRYLGIKLFPQAVNYTGGTGLTTVKVTGAGNDNLTLTPTLTAGYEPTTAAVVAGGTGYTTGDIVRIVDATGTGAQYTVTANAGVVSAVVYVANSATASPIDPANYFASIALDVAGVSSFRGVATKFYSMLDQALGAYPRLGELPIRMIDPDRNHLQDNDLTAWDLVGAKTFTIRFRTAANLVKPTLAATRIFDNQRNFIDQGGGKVVLFNRPIKYVEQVVDLKAGITPITNLTLIGDLQRLWVLGDTPGNITQMEVTDGTKRFDLSYAEMLAHYGEYGIRLGQPDWTNQSYATSNALKAAINPIHYFDFAYIPDADGRTSKKLKPVSNLTLNITSAVAQKATLLIESAPVRFM